MFALTKLCRRLECSSRLFCTKSPDSISILRSKYPTDSWTNIKPQFVPHIGANLHKKRSQYGQKKHPLTATHQEITAYLRQWFEGNVDATNPLKIYENLDPVEPNTDTVKQPYTFYVNQSLKLRNDLFDREKRYLKDGLTNFAILTDMYRRCIMDATHFPVFHRLNVVRTMQPNPLSSAADVCKQLEYEQKTVLETIVKRLFDDDVRFRWVEAKSTALQPYRILEIWHNDQWLKVSGAGIIQNNLLPLTCQENGMVGWEIGIGLDRFVMAMFKIFDMRILWNGDTTYLNQFVPNSMDAIINAADKVSTIKQKKAAAAAQLKAPKVTVPTPTKTTLQVAYLLPENTILEEFPTNQLCDTIKKLGENRIEDVRFLELTVQFIRIVNYCFEFFSISFLPFIGERS